MCECGKRNLTQLASTSSTETPHSLARVFIRFRAILTILFDRRLAIQSRADQIRYPSPLSKRHRTPQRSELLYPAAHEPLQAFSLLMQVSTAPWPLRSRI